MDADTDTDAIRRCIRMSKVKILKQFAVSFGLPLEAVGRTAQQNVTTQVVSCDNDREFKIKKSCVNNDHSVALT
eukprot:scaffold11021_cov136-Skeletonema_menzelii.AAC.1